MLWARKSQLDSTPLYMAKFQKEHGCERCAVGKKFDIAEEQFGHGKRALLSEGI